MNLIIDNKKIDTDIKQILLDIQALKPEKNLFSTIENKGDYFRITCPVHKNGQESKPSCSIYSRTDNDKVIYGTCHCFTCGYKAQLPKLISYCLDISEQAANEWLLDRSSDYLIYNNSININDKISFQHKDTNYIDETILDQYKYFHQYMFNRKLTEEIIKKFSIGYDSVSDSIVFPVWDQYGNLVTITKRSISGKKFQLESNKDKPVYLLNFLIKDNIDIAYVCESQINALTLWTYGLPGIALFGTGSQYQYDILNKSGIRKFILCFDGDDAGKKGRDRFIKNINQNCIIQSVQLPLGKDVNDLSKEEFFDILSKKF